MIYLWLLLMVLVILHISIRYSKRGRMLAKIPGNINFPLLGHSLRAIGMTDTEFWRYGRMMSQTYYPVTKYCTSFDSIVSICHPDDIQVLEKKKRPPLIEGLMLHSKLAVAEDILIYNFDGEIILSSQEVIEKGFIYDFLQPWLKTGLLTSTGKKWFHRRKILEPAFYYGILKKYIDISSEQGKKLVDHLNSEGEESIQNLVPFCTKYTLNIICESVTGISLDTLDSKEIEEYKNAIQALGKLIIYRVLRPYFTSEMIFSVTKMGRKQREIIKTLHQFTSKLIDARREYHKLHNNKYLKEYSKDKNIINESNIGQKRRLLVLDLLLAAQQNGLIDDEGIQEEIDTFIFEGFDTTGMSFIFTLLLLAENKEAQDRARAEVTKLFKKNNGNMEMANFKELSYLERCIKESLRLFPVVSTLLRFTQKDLQLKNVLIPEKTSVAICAFDTHRDPKFWPKPKTFDPDRFLPENSKKRHPYAYLPFSIGLRNCIGQKFAMIELKLLLSKVLYKFYLESVIRTEDIELAADIVLHPPKPVYVKFVKINK